MTKINAIKSLLFCYLCNFVLLAEAADCQTMILNFVEGWTPKYLGQANEKVPALPQTGRSIQAVLTCHGQTTHFPTSTLFHFVEEREDGRICYRDRACGDVNSWNVHMGVFGSWWNHTSRLGNLLLVDNLVHYSTENNGNTIAVNVGIDFGRIDRFCQNISEEICL